MNLVRCLHMATASTSRLTYTPKIGLEVHVQLASVTKLFSGARVADDAPPNSTVDRFDMATPGTLPALNKECVMFALQMAHAFSCEVASWCRFDRKHYFYADMPAGYQITQADHPIARNGHFDIYVYGRGVDTYRKRVAIERLQLEQDSGKTIHEAAISLIDLNRAGAPLVEIVTAPIFRSAIEATCFVQQLRLLLMHHGICRGQLHKGHIRVDANVSISNNDEIGTRTEIKNLNSFRFLHTAINYEIDRQFHVISSGGRVINETRGIDSIGRTLSMRDKEEETDYRIMPEPNLPRLIIHPEWLKTTIQKNEDVGLPLYEQYIQRFGMEPSTAVEFSEDPEMSSFFDSCSPSIMERGSTNKDLIELSLFLGYLQDLKNICQREELSFPPKRKGFALEFCAALQLLQSSRITRLVTLSALRKALREEIEHIEEFIHTEKLWRIRSETEIKQLLVEICHSDISLITKAREGNKKALTKLRNLLINRSRKCVDIEDVVNAINAYL